MLDGVGWNLFQRKFFIQHFLASSTEYTCWTRLKWFTVYSNVFIKKKFQYEHENSSEEETNPAKGSAFKAHMKGKEKQEKAEMVQEVAYDKMAEGKETT